MSKYPIHNISRTLIDISKNEFENFIQLADKKCNELYQFDDMDSIILDYSKFEAVLKLTKLNLKNFHEKSKKQEIMYFNKNKRKLKKTKS